MNKKWLNVLLFGARQSDGNWAMSAPKARSSALKSAKTRWFESRTASRKQLGMRIPSILSTGCIFLMSLNAFAQSDRLQQGAAKNFIPVAPGVVKDTSTGLEWMRCGLGQDWDMTANTCVGNLNKYSYQEALSITQEINNKRGFAKHTDWRVPTIRELLSLRFCPKGYEPKAIIENIPDGGVGAPSYCSEGNARPTIAQSIFPNTPSNGDEKYFWSSTLNAKNSTRAWYMGFSMGDLDSDAGTTGSEVFSVRLVRFTGNERVSALAGIQPKAVVQKSSCSQFYQGQIVRGKIFNPYYVGEVKVTGVGTNMVSLVSMKSDVSDELTCDRLIELMNK
ncbi:hypothetical protein DIC66_22505 [Rhodoferax lacus]|uniref:Lcl C-terminal domain-containing protein n=1 Tax=Rhodoferax lacus TaxID=2184758 RepID=A0A3E1R5H7_9BURK|nr:DUF1566 domain-containing protein [Rhodoferax lacus]RFO94628.1 hypothetical protein DIC66_22505 [Rhodoferax lacus]